MSQRNVLTAFGPISRKKTAVNTPSLAAAAVGVLLAFGAVTTAHAGATITIDGITVPVGIVPGGNQIQSGILDETLITAPGQQLQAVGFVNTIDTPGFAQTWQNGQNGVELAFVVSGYTANISAFPTVTFTGGNATFYVLPAGTAITGYGTVAADILAIQTAALHTFLTVTAAPEDGAGDTLVSNILVGTSLSNFSAADGSGFLDVSGGDAAAAFATQTFANSFNSTGFSDLSLTSDFSTSSTDTGDGFGVSGSATLKANAIPEPLSLGLLGIGLTAIGVLRRRSR
jgi:hypothetical protein